MEERTPRANPMFLPGYAWHVTHRCHQRELLLKFGEDTGQEQPAFWLPHYNGRVYDPILGQFLSADPLVASPFDPQNANRRSYVLNNPLKYVDPSAFVDEVSCPESDCTTLPGVTTSAPPGGGGFDAGWASFIGGGGSWGSGACRCGYEPGAGRYHFGEFKWIEPLIDTIALEESLTGELEAGIAVTSGDGVVVHEDDADR